MNHRHPLQFVEAELDAGMQLAKCRKCGCMQETLNNLTEVLPHIDSTAANRLNQEMKEWIRQMEPMRYACLGCEHCYPAVAQNAFSVAFPAIELGPALDCELQIREEGWPPFVGEYFVLDRAAPVAVSTLSSMSLAANLAERKPDGLAIVGKTETENIGIDKLVKNVITNSSLRYLIVAGLDPKGHLPGKTLLALAQNGVDENRRVIGSPGKRPILRNVSAAEIQAFRDQVQVIDMVRCENLDEMSVRIEELSRQITALCECSECDGVRPVSISITPKITATEPGQVVKMDKAGYFVIVPLADREVISVEHYAYDNTLLRVIEGQTARSLYSTIIANGWVTELSHAAYLGKELVRAELSFNHDFTYVQDGA